MHFFLFLTHAPCSATFDWSTGDPHRRDGEQAHPQRNSGEAEEDFPAPRPAPYSSPGDADGAFSMTLKLTNRKSELIRT